MPRAGFRSFDFDPDLIRFQHSGGRLLIDQGWADPVVAPQDTIRYYESVVRAAGEGHEPAMARLFLIPGTGHCSGGPGPGTVDGLGALATHSTNGRVDRTRPLRPYPQIARWDGGTDDAASYECVSPRP
jgi:feruloyl esterase